MVITVFQLKSTPYKTAELIQALRSLVRPARAEKGFIAGQITLDADDANTIRYEERWESKEDLDSQVLSSRFTHLLALMEASAERPTLEFHFVKETRGLDYVADVRGQQGQFKSQVTNNNTN